MELGSQIYDITVTQPASATDDKDKDAETDTAGDASADSAS